MAGRKRLTDEQAEALRLREAAIHYRGRRPEVDVACSREPTAQERQAAATRVAQAINAASTL